MNTVSRQEFINVYLGNTIKNIRKSLNITQKQLAEKVGVSYQQICKYENIIDSVKPAILVKIADAFGLGVNDLMPQKANKLLVSDNRAEFKKTKINKKNNQLENIKKTNIKTIDFLNVFMKLSNDEQDKIISFAKNIGNTKSQDKIKKKSKQK